MPVEKLDCALSGCRAKPVRPARRMAKVERTGPRPARFRKPADRGDRASQGAPPMLVDPYHPGAGSDKLPRRER